MTFTLKDVVQIVGLLAVGFAQYLAIEKRITKLELAVTVYRKEVCINANAIKFEMADICKKIGIEPHYLEIAPFTKPEEITLKTE